MFPQHDLVFDDNMPQLVHHKECIHNNSNNNCEHEMQNIFIKHG